MAIYENSTGDDSLTAARPRRDRIDVGVLAGGQRFWALRSRCKRQPGRGLAAGEFRGSEAPGVEGGGLRSAPVPRQPVGYRIGGHGKRWGVSVGPVLWAVALASCAPPEAGVPPRPNILLVSLDTVRADFLSPYSDGQWPTPTIQRLADDGIVFDHAVSSSPWTFPAHASLFTGLPVSVHGARYDTRAEIGVAWHRVSLMDPRIPTLAEVLGEAGYHTAGAAAVVWLKEEYGLSRGFQQYVAEVDDIRGEPADRMTDRGLQLLQDRPLDRPFFQFLHYFDAHSPYTPPARHRPEGVDHDGSIAEVEARVNSGGTIGAEERASLEALYGGEIRFVDEQLGRVVAYLEAQGLYDDTWIIVVADHGESFGAHDFFGHGVVTWEDVVHVPLIMKPPRSFSGRLGRHVATRVQAAEIVPTILDGLQIERPAHVEGRNLLNVAGSRWKNDPRIVVTEVFRNLGMNRRFGSRWDRDVRSIYLGDHKLTVRSDGVVAVYDLAKDPGELHNRAAADLDRLDALSAELDQWLQWTGEHAYQGRPAEIDTEDAERLKALGYLGG